MKQPQQNLFVDVAAFVAFVLLAATGVLMAYVLPPGSGRALTVWGLSRHEWGDVHFWIAIVLLGILAVHLVLHWKWIVCMVRGRPTTGSQARWRVGLGMVGLTALLALVVALLLSPTQPPEGASADEHRAEPGTSSEVENAPAERRSSQTRRQGRTQAGRATAPAPEPMTP